VSADRDRLSQIRAEHERTTHPDWRDATTVGVLLTELDRAEAETADLWEALAERRAVAQKLAEHADEVTAERDSAVAEASALRNRLDAILAECDRIEREVRGQHDEDDDGKREAVARIRATAAVAAPEGGQS
jgi:uncharacterized coiled-coil DUF342 family protein